MASYPLDFSDRTATSSSASSTSSISSASASSPSSGASSMSSSLILAPTGPSSGSSTSSPGRKAVVGGSDAGERKRRSRSPGLSTTGTKEKLMSKMTWDGYGQDILAEFEQFWRLGDFLDVTLICDDLTLRAHKIVLAASSHYFERILCESECKHPVISLNGFQGWQVEACLEFIYKGVVHLPIDQVIDVVAIAQELEIRGLSDYMDKLEAEILKSSILRDESPSPLPVDMRNNNRVEKEPTKRTTTGGAGAGIIIMRDSAAHEDRQDEEEEDDKDDDEEDGPRSPKCLNLSMSAHLNERPQTAGVTENAGTRLEASVALSSGSSNNSITNAILRQSPLRRKQARPRRRSGDFVAQDLRKVNESPTGEKDHVIDYTVPSLPPMINNNNNNSSHNNNNAGPPPKPAFHIAADNNQNHHPIPALFHHLHHPHHLPHHLLHHPDLLPPRMQQSPSKNNNSDDGMSAPNCGISPPGSPPHFFFPKASPPSPDDPHACSTPPSFPPLPFPNGFGQPGPWPLPLGPAPIFGRHRAQHSAPRGGPPRAWSNADLTEALHNVWNKKMTTSQASRIFGIPYNSLLMYVRGKYGKSLKLDLLKKGLDMALENKNNNKSKSPENITPEFNPFAAGLFPDYPPHFPFASALSHILPPPGMDVKGELGKTEDLK